MLHYDNTTTSGTANDAVPALAKEARCGAMAGWLVMAAATLLTACGSSELAEPESSGTPLRVRLMTGEQFSNTMSDIFGADISNAVPAPLPPLTRTDGLLASGAASVGLTSDQAQQLQQAATAIAAKVVDKKHRNFLIPCKPESLTEPDNLCATEFLKETGRLLYRRPLDEVHVGVLTDVAAEGARQTDDFYAGLAVALEVMLISPEVIFIIESSEADPDNPGQERLDAYTLASRLSFFLWDSAPDAALLDAAENGELDTDEGLARTVERMLGSSRLEDGLRAFFDDMMEFDDFASLAKDPIVYPTVTGATLADAREQTLRTVIDHVLVRDRDYRDLFTTRDTFMSMNLAAIYGVPTNNGWVPYEFPEDSKRAGLLTQVSFLAAHSHSVRSSPTLRGKALRELFLCQVVPPPPPDVDFSLLEDAGDVATARERIDIHTTNPSCAGCHLITDPIGLALENFDGAGNYREKENNVVIDTTGVLDGVNYGDPDGLAVALRDHEKLPTCLVNRAYAYGTGGPVDMRSDREVLEFFEARFVEQGYKVKDLLRDIATSQVFKQVRPGNRSEAVVASASSIVQSHLARTPN